MSSLTRPATDAGPSSSGPASLPRLQTPVAPARRSKPLQTLRGLCSLVDCREDAALALIESGKVAFAFNLAVRPESGSKELRILPAAIADYLTGRECSLTMPEVLAMILPEPSPELPGVALCHRLNLSSTHIYNLIEAGHLSACSTWKSGPRNSVRIQRSSVEMFLQYRRWPYNA